MKKSLHDYIETLDSLENDVISINLFDDKIIQALKDARDGDIIFMPESDYGFGEIYKIHNWLIVFLIPNFGGIPEFHNAYRLSDVEDMIQELRSLT
jgi:hypothetical protein